MAEPICSLAAGGVSANSSLSGTEFEVVPSIRFGILKRYTNIAMVGLSANPMRPSYFAATYLKNRGYNIIPVNPRATEILGRRCYASLKEVESPIDVVDIFRPSEHVPLIVEEAIEVGAKVIWMQFGVIHKEAARRALEAGLEVVMDQCMKVEHARFFGGLNAMGLNSGVLSSRGWGPGDGNKGLG